MDFPSSYTGLGYGGTKYDYGMGGSFSAGAAMQQNQSSYHHATHSTTQQSHQSTSGGYFVPAVQHHNMTVPNTQAQEPQWDQTPLLPCPGSAAPVRPSLPPPPAMAPTHAEGRPPKPPSFPPAPASAVPVPPTTASPFIPASFSHPSTTATAPTFSPSAVDRPLHCPLLPPPTGQNAMNSLPPKVDMEDLNRVAQMGRDRAQGIISQIRGQTEAAEIGRNRAKLILDQFKDKKTVDINEPLPEEYGRKRRAFMEQFDEKRRKAMLKNLEYIARIEEERMKERFMKMQEAQEYEAQMEEYHARDLESRSKNHASTRNSSIQNSQAGIGTEHRQRAEKKRKQQTSTNDSLAIYVSNLPKDNSASDELMRALFGSYGSLRKIHFYVDKKTGAMKGDALVIYHVEDMNEKSELTEAVCTQMNGATLACGTVLKVEPSDPLYQLRKAKQTNYFGGADQEEPEVIEANTQTEATAVDDTKSADGEDLDDFFASL